jgi:hypothetical protein
MLSTIDIKDVALFASISHAPTFIILEKLLVVSAHITQFLDWINDSTVHVDQGIGVANNGDCHSKNEPKNAPYHSFDGPRKDDNADEQAGDQASQVSRPID